MAKLRITRNGITVKLEVNVAVRGTMGDTEEKRLCARARDVFERDIYMKVVPFGQLYGGKICAALARQYPRDIFDAKLFMENEVFSAEVRKGFIFYAVSGQRTIRELIDPPFIDESEVRMQTIAGMTTEEFLVGDYLETRRKLTEAVRENLTDDDKDFLLGVKNCQPDWKVYDFQCFPAVQWKLKNLRGLKKYNPRKHEEDYGALKKALG